MDITEMFKDAFKYSATDWGKVLILGLLIIGVTLLAFITGFSAIFGQYVVVIILGLITLIFGNIMALIYNGYSLSIIKDTVVNSNISIGDQKETLPEFRWSENIVDGFKVLILNIVYMIIPFIVAIILAYALGVFSDFASISQSLNLYNLTTGAQLPSTISTVNLNYVGYSLAIVRVVFLILAVIFTVFATIATARLAETGRLSSIIEFREVLNTVSKIGWGNYIIWFILFYIILIVLAVVASLIIFIPLIGLIIYLLIVPSFLIVFKSRAIGLIYNESK